MENFDKQFIKTFSIDGIIYKRSWLETQGGHKLRFVTTYSDYMGISDASILATHMASKLGIKKIFIIPNESIAFQRGKLNENGFSYGVQIAQPKGFIKCDEALDILESLRSNYFMKLLKAGKDSFESTSPKVHYEAMACADYVIDKKGEIDNIANTIAKRKLCAVDMESYAIYRVGDMLDVETMVIKSVMDLTNDKSDKYKSYAAFMAANYLYQLLYQEIIR
jgi:nucleoside phosphorylase